MTEDIELDRGLFKAPDPGAFNTKMKYCCNRLEIIISVIAPVSKSAETCLFFSFLVPSDWHFEISLKQKTLHGDMHRASPTNF